MVLRFAFLLALGLAAACLAQPVAAQSPPAAFGSGANPPQRDPFGGRLGGFEVAFSPSEAVRQNAMINAALDALSPQRPGRQDVYVLAAGFWSDPVFESEASRSAAALAGALGGQGRTLVLSAGAGGAPRSYPAANPANLQLALGRIGQLIDPAEDLVVLFLTSHGGPQGMALHEEQRLRGNLSPVALRAALSEAGIRRRVVIVSACYSGVFVRPLADDDTIVLTAAAPDRTSFGCQPEREWTYFGDALVNQGLLQGKPLLSAFEDGLGLISQWERRDNFTPSNPQRHVGGRAAAALAAAEAAAGAAR